MMGNVKTTDEATISTAISESGLQLEGLGNGLATKLGDSENDPLHKVQKDLGCKPSQEFVVLSGGHQRRLDVAQLLARLREARFLILDEPEANLDAGKFELLDKILAKRPKNCTVLLITHCMEMTRGVDLIYVMEKGEMVQCGTHDDLMKLEDGIYYRLQMADCSRRFESSQYCPNCGHAGNGRLDRGPSRRSSD